MSFIVCLSAIFVSKRQTFLVTTEKQNQIVVSDYHDFDNLKHMVNSLFFRDLQATITEKVAQYIEKSFCFKEVTSWKNFEYNISSKTLWA